MEENRSRWEGWSKKSTAILLYLQCPRCLRRFEGLCVNSDNTIDCPACGQNFPHDAMRTVPLRKPVVTCKACGQEVSLTTGNRSYLWYVCAQCRNVVAVVFRNYVVRPRTVLSLGWNKGIETRAEKIAGSLHFVECKTERDFLVTKVLQHHAKDEGEPFMTLREETDNAGLFVMLPERKYVGYIVWSKAPWEGMAALRQIYLVEGERKKGYGTQLLRYWVEHYADKVNAKFGIESPNEISRKLLVKLGYARIEGKNLVGIKCVFVAGM